MIFETFESHGVSADVHNQMGFVTESTQILVNHSFGLVSCYEMRMLSEPFVDLSSVDGMEDLGFLGTQF